MTIVCCWFDRSYGRRRITAVADARAAYKQGKQWIPLAETTVKLFKADVKCHAMAALDPCGVWTQPYYQTEIGIGFAGYCFEALSIIALLSRCLEQLVIDGEDRPKPRPDGIVNFAKEIAARYFTSHSVPAQQTVEFVIFGFSPEKGEPWISFIFHNSRDGIRTEIFHHPMQEDRAYLIGDIDICHDLQPHADEIIGRIRSHAAGLAEGGGEDAAFEHVQELARHQDAQKKILEELVLSKFPKRATVGGVLQKLELFQQGAAAVAAFTRDDRPHILHTLPVLHKAGLGYVSIDEVMGRKTGSK
jgi:hypothetical protein